MSSKIRKQIYLEPRQEARVKEIAKLAGVSEAEVIRQAIDRHLGSINPPKTNIAAWEEEKSFINQAKQRPSLPGGRDWRRSDLYER